MEQMELCWRDRGRLWLRLGIRAVLTAGFLLLLFLAVPPLVSLFMPFVLAFLLAWLLNPAVRLLQRRLGLPRNVLALILVLLIFGVAGDLLFLFSYNIVTELLQLTDEWQTIWNGISGAIWQIGGSYSGFLSLLPPVARDTATALLERLTVWLQTVIPELLARFASQTGILAMQIPSFAVALVAFVMGAYFLTADYPRLRFLAAERLSPGLRSFLRMVRVTTGAAFGGYLRAQLILSVVVFFILLLGFLLIREPFSLLLAFLLAVLDFIPIVGAGTAMVPWAIVLFFTGNLRKAVSLMVIWGVIVLFRRVGEPKVLGSQTGLSPILSLVSIYVGMRLGGVLGMILAPVLCLVFLSIYKSGLLDGTFADLKLAAQDLSALLSARPQS